MQTRCYLLGVSDREVVDAIKRAFTDENVVVFDPAEQVSIGADWGATISDGIRLADFLITDISRVTPALFYEIGIAHALRKPVIYLKSANSDESVPSELSGFLYIVYDPADPSELVPHLHRAARRYFRATEAGR